MSLKVLFRVPLGVWHGVQGSGKGTFRQLREICPDSKIGRLFQCLASPPYAFSSECTQKDPRPAKYKGSYIWLEKAEEWASADLLAQVARASVARGLGRGRRHGERYVPRAHQRPRCS